VPARFAASFRWTAACEASTTRIWLTRIRLTVAPAVRDFLTFRTTRKRNAFLALVVANAWTLPVVMDTGSVPIDQSTLLTTVATEFGAWIAFNTFRVFALVRLPRRTRRPQAWWIPDAIVARWARIRLADVFDHVTLICLLALRSHWSFGAFLAVT